MLFGLGLLLSWNKPLWNDEIYTQIDSVQGYKAQEILSGKLSEGNNAPLFYLIQKLLCSIAGYRLSSEWSGQWKSTDPAGQILLRIPSSIFMTLLIAGVFYFFACNFSLWTGVYSVIISLTSPMVWSYWVEARPYSLWMFLTGLQLLSVLTLGRTDKPSPRLWNWLSGIHLLLAFTVALSIMQIVIAAGVLWFSRKNGPGTYWLGIAGSLCICLFYYIQSPRFQFFFADSPLARLVLDNISLGQILIIGFYGIVILYSQYARTSGKIADIETGKAYMALFSLFAFATAALLVFLKTGDTFGKTGFEISSRYFIYLTPVGIIGTVLLSDTLVRSFRTEKWMLTNTAIILAGFVVYRVFAALMHVQG